MITSDKTDIVYRFLTLITAISAAVLSIISIPGYFLKVEAESSMTKYLYKSYLVISFTILIDEITYIVPSSTILFYSNKPVCVAFACIQYVVENMIYLFITAMAFFMYFYITENDRAKKRMGVLNGKNADRDKTSDKKHHNYSKILFIFWPSFSLSYSFIFLIVTLYFGAIDVRDNRCWFVNDVGSLSDLGFRMITHRIFMYVAVIVSVVFAIIVAVRVRQFSKAWKKQAQHMDEIQAGNDVYVILKVMNLNGSLLRKFILFAALVLALVVISLATTYIGKNHMKGLDSSSYLGWIDPVYIILFFLPGFIFFKKFTETTMERFNSYFEKLKEKMELKSDPFNKFHFIVN